MEVREFDAVDYDAFAGVETYVHPQGMEITPYISDGGFIDPDNGNEYPCWVIVDINGISVEAYEWYDIEMVRAYELTVPYPIAKLVVQQMLQWPLTEHQLYGIGFQRHV